MTATRSDVDKFVRLARDGETSRAFALIADHQWVDFASILADLAAEAPTASERRFISALERQLLDHGRGIRELSPPFPMP